MKPPKPISVTLESCMRGWSIGVSVFSRGYRWKSNLASRRDVAKRRAPDAICELVEQQCVAFEAEAAELLRKAAEARKAAAAIKAGGAWEEV